MIESDHHGKLPKESKTTCAKLNDLVTLKRGHLSWFRYPTHNIGTYLGRGVQDVDVGAMGRRKSNFLPFEEIFSHDRDKSAPDLLK